MNTQTVIPAQAGIQNALGPRLRGDDRGRVRAGVFAVAVAVACLLALGGCAALPPPAALPALHDSAAHASAPQFQAATIAWPEDGWWRAYGDAQLDTLMREALAAAPSMAAAQARLARAQSLVQSTAAADRPQLSANASLSEQRQSSNYLSPPAATPKGWNDYGRATLDLHWDLDLWGANRAALQAATSEALATEADLAQARLVLTTSLAAAYVEYARLQAALDTAQAAARVRADTEQTFRDRFAQGLENQPAVRQAQARRAQAQGDALLLAEQLQLQGNRIAVLAGAGPERATTLVRPTLDLRRAPGLPPALAADLVGRRPDLVAARLRTEAAGQRIGQARAAFYPDVNLMAFIGVQSLGLNMLARGGSVIGSAGPAISLPIFDGGRLRGQLRGAEADYAAAVASYDATLLQALQEVADAVTSQRALGGELERTDEAVQASREAWQLQQMRLRGGLASALDVLTAEDTLLALERARTDLDARALALDVALTKALGGGYAPAQP